jgi:hypothetical protein
MVVEIPALPTAQELAAFNGIGEYSPSRIIARRLNARTAIALALATSVVLALASFAL